MKITKGSCPVGPKFQSLVEEFGKGDALKAYNILQETNPGAMPTPEQVKDILANNILMEKDEIMAKRNTASKLKRVAQDINLLEKKKKIANDRQKITFDKLIYMNRQYQLTLAHQLNAEKSGKTPEKTISVTNFKGKSNFKGDSDIYESYRNTGDFVHNMLEDLEKKSFSKNMLAKDLFSEKYFNDYFDKFTKNNVINFENLDKDLMFSELRVFVEKMSNVKYDGAIVLPEITVVGQSAAGKTIIGRLDLLIIDSIGEVEIIDYKTKHIKGITEQDSTGVVHINRGKALAKLGQDEYKVKYSKESPNELNQYNRSIYDEWMLQLEVYDKLLAQGGITTSRKTISMMAYSVDDKNRFEGLFVYNFDDHDYYNQSLVDGNTTSNTIKINNLKQIIEENIPANKDIVKEKEEEEKKTPEEKYEFNPTEKNATNLVTQLKRLITKQRENAYNELNELRPGEINNLKREAIKNRIETLNNFLNILNKSEVDNSTIARSISFFSALDTVSRDLDRMSELSNKVIEEFERINDPLKSLQQRSEILNLFLKANALNLLIKEMDNIINEAAKNPENEITEDSDVRKKISKMKTDLNNVTANFRSITVTGNNIIFRTPGEQVYKGVNKDLVDKLTPQIKYIDSKIKKLEARGKLGLGDKLKHKYRMLTDKTYRKNLEEQKVDKTNETDIAIEKLQKEKIKLEQLIRGFELSDDAITEYIDAITDPDSILYIGNPNIFNADTILQGFNQLQFGIASVNNSERAISATTMMMKNVISTAERNAMNDPKMLKLDAIRKKMLKNHSLSELNQKISSFRTVPYYDSKTNSIKNDSRRLFLIKPFSEKYETDFRNLQLKTRVLNKEYRDLTAKANTALKSKKDGEITQEEYDKVQEERFEKKKEKEQARKDYLNFIVKYATLPYTDAFYKIQSLLPEHIASKMQELYYEEEIIMFEVADGNILELEDEDFDRIKEISVELKKLREQAKEEDPQYAAYIDKFNELYEYDTNQRYFDSARNRAEVLYGKESAEYAKWLNENQVVKPTSEWFTKVHGLYERRSELYEVIENLFPSSFKDKLKGLYEARTKLLRQYKQYSRIQPRLMTNEDVAEYDKLQEEIERVEELANKERKENRKKNKEKWPQAISKELSSINKELATLVTSNHLSEVYQEDLKDNLESLNIAFSRMKSLEKDKKDSEEHYRQNPNSELKDKAEKANSEYRFYEEQFIIAEQKFEKWFNKHHTNKYTTIRDNRNSIDNAEPKQYNFERMPGPLVKDEYTETVPNPKYYKVKKLRKENWYYNENGIGLDENGEKDIKNAEHLSSEEIKARKADENFDIDTEITEGRLVTREGAFNPNFHKGPDNVLLPKGIVYKGNNEYDILPGYENHEHIDPQFKAIKQDKDLNELYNAATDMYFSLQEKIEGRKVGYQVPGFPKNFVEQVSGKKGLGDIIKSQGKLFWDKHAKTGSSKQDYIDNAFGDLGARPRMRYTHQLPEGMQSEDTLSSILKYTVEAHYNIAIQEVAPMVDSFIEYLHLLKSDIEEGMKAGEIRNSEGRIVDMGKRSEQLQHVISVIEFERRKFIYGQPDAVKNRAVKKYVSNLFSYTSFIRIGFDVANQVKNNVAGNMQALVAAGVGYRGEHYTRKNWIWAKNKVFNPSNGFMKNYFHDWGNISDLSTSTMMYRFFNPVQKDIKKYFDEIAGGKARSIASRITSVQEMGYFGQDKGESEIGVTIMYAVMDHYHYRVVDKWDDKTGDPIYKTDADGNYVTVPTHEIYIKGEHGELMRREDVDYNDEDEAFIRNIIYSEMRRAQGNYAKKDMTKFEEMIIGKMVFYFKKYLIPQFLNRFGYARPSWEAGQVSLGYWRAFIQANKYYGTGSAMRELLFGSMRSGNNKEANHGSIILKHKVDRRAQHEEEIFSPENLKDNQFYLRKIGHARRDAMAMSILAVLSLLALTYVRQKDDDDEELSVLTGNAFRVLWGVKGELLSMMPVGGGSQEYIRNFTTAVPVVREFNKLNSMIGHGFKYGMAMIMNGGQEPDPDQDGSLYAEIYKDAFYVKKSGPYESGTSKLVKDIVDLSGIRNFRDLLQPENRIDQMKRNQ